MACPTEQKALSIGEILHGPASLGDANGDAIGDGAGVGVDCGLATGVGEAS